jgi:hypothetical protein
LEFFISDAKDSSGDGEGQTYQVTRSVTTDRNGNATFRGVRFAGRAGQWVTVTATDPSGNTSVFSPPKRVVAAAVPSLSSAAVADYLLHAKANTFGRADKLHKDLVGLLAHSVSRVLAIQPK